MKIKVLSWNIWLKGNLDGVLQFIKRSDADIVGLQEVIPEREPNIIASLETLGYQSAFSTISELRKDGRAMGNAIFSKYPIQSHATYVLSETERRVAIGTDIDINGQIVHVFSTHLVHKHLKPSEIQELQTQTLLAAVPKERTLVMGDFNATPESATIELMKRELMDTDPNSQPTWSVYPALECHGACNPNGVEIRFDYIFASKELKTESFKIGESDASDHLPISVIVEI